MLLIEALLGYPDRLFRRIGHPVVWIGALIGALERRLNDPILPEARRRLNGVAALLLVVAAAVLAGTTIQMAAFRLLPRWAAVPAIALLASALPAQRSLHRHVAAVRDALRAGGLDAGRRAVSHIVGRDPESLDEAAVARAAIESLAENFSDGVAGPAIWCLLAGLPGAVVYKAVNTADSMIGHLTPQLRSFGWASARLDDWLNLPASRLSALWIVLAALDRPAAAARAVRAVRRDARHHRSPNAGWPEAAMAGALGLRIGGPRRYGDRMVQDNWMGDGRAEAGAADIDRALRLYRRACALEMAGLCVPALLAAAFR
ncbi:adenosylcobinamide-phosphate synthase CbiB [Rhizosaccharibacter radicis]|uniref:Cobalamin biosynthesis protein CobD n=1 Tax=Rhizosaccharibacter radicis TaxID=2782605 RepID=A0ABT1VY83_9PROT|nr:adenosylcobinamide-phosphate synthase CbiB [Acetobacteraceae bacterium KSS12]